MGLIASFAAWALLVGCHGSPVNSSGCKEDSDCGRASAFRCEPSTGECFCRNDQGCDPSTFCNGAGFCQDRAGCEKNEDCIDPTLFCDTRTGTCLSYGRCNSDLHCALGSVCDLEKGTCAVGCHSAGDCSGTACRCGDKPCDCDGGTENERSACTVGVCDSNYCSDESFCRFGEVCAVSDGGSALARCFNDYQPNLRPYCDVCTYVPGEKACGYGPNFCLIDTVHPGSSFCGADCSGGQVCPRGYSCQDVIVVGGGLLPACDPDTPCPTRADLPCGSNTDCPFGGDCKKLEGQDAGFCAGQCHVGEGESFGFCSCLTQNDCAGETCSQNECTISRRPCVSDGDCRPLRCVDFDGVGGCLVGENCAPADGLSCEEVRQ